MKFFLRFVILGCCCLSVQCSNDTANSTLTKWFHDSNFWNSSCYQFIQETRDNRITISLFGQSQAVCLGETYHFGHQIQKYKAECSVEPKDESLSYADSTWAVYSCIVKKSLGSRRLTLTNYAEMMSGNLSASVKSAIHSILDEPQINQDSAAGEAGDLNLIRRYWKSYFNAEFQVCTNTTENTCEKSDTNMFLRHSWDSLRYCQGENIPEMIGIGWTPWTWKTSEKQLKVQACIGTFNQTHTITNWTSEIKTTVRSLCRFAANGIITQDQVDQPSISKSILYYNDHVAPGYFSKSVKQQVFHLLKQDLSFELLRLNKSSNSSLMMAENVKDLFSLTAERLKGRLDAEGHTEESSSLVINLRIFLELVYSNIWNEFSLCLTSMDQPKNGTTTGNTTNYE